MSNFSVSATFKAIDQFTAPLKKMSSATSSFANKAEVGVARAERGFRKLLAPVNKLNRALGGFGLILGGSLIVGAVGNAINTFKDFEQSGANLSAVLGVTKSEILDLSNDAKRLGSTTAFTASQVSSLQTEFAKLGFAQDEIINATESTLALAAATNTELPQAARQVGAAVKGFGLSTKETQRVVDVFAASTSKSALDMEFLATAMSKVAPVANSFGFSIEDSTALLGSLADAGFDASTAATSTRSILLNLADSNGKLAKALGRPVNSLPELVAGLKELDASGVDLASALDLTDKRSVSAFQTFLKGTDGLEKLSGALNKAGGTAQSMAETQLNTLQGRLTILGSAWEGFILSLEDGTGAFSETLKTIIEVTTEVLALASGTAKAEGELSKKAATIREYAKTAIQVAKVVGYVIAVLVAFKVALVAARTALSIYKAITKGWIKVTEAAAAAQKALNFVMNMNPIGLVIAAIVALIAIVVLAIKYWDSWGAALLAFMGPIGWIINGFMMLKKNWDLIKKSFEVGGIIGGLKAIGITILQALLTPVEQVLNAIGYLPDWLGGGLATDAASSIAKLKNDLQAELETTAGVDAEDRPVINNEQTKQETLVQRLESTQRQQLDVNINDENDRAEVINSGDVFSMPTINKSFAT